MSFDQDRDPPDLWTFTLTSATTAEEVARMTVTVEQPAQQVGEQSTFYKCFLDMTAHLQRVSKD
jgi:hypothetical protein